MSSLCNKAWVSKHRLRTEYLDGLVHFIEFIKKNEGGFNHFPCPCAKCRNGHGMIAVKLINEHLLIYGIDKSYTDCIFRGDSLVTIDGEPSISESSDRLDDVYARMEELVNDVFGRIGKHVDSLIDDLIRNGDSDDNSPKSQGHKDHKASR